MSRITRKRSLVAIGCVAALVVAAAAYAYFTSTGSGTATAKVGTASAVTLKGTVAGNLYPGASSQVSFTVDNPSGGAQRVGTITLTGITVDAGHSTCSVVITGGNPDFTVSVKGFQSEVGGEGPEYGVVGRCRLGHRLPCPGLQRRVACDPGPAPETPRRDLGKRQEEARRVGERAAVVVRPAFLQTHLQLRGREWLLV